MANLFHTFLYQPIFNLLIVIFTTLPFRDMGISIILLTILIRIVLWPLARKQIDAQKQLRDLQPKLNEIKNKYKGDREQQNKEIMRFYKENNANPLSSCLPLLIQLPILWAVFRVFSDGLKPEALDALYGFVARPESISPFFLGFSAVDLSAPNIVLTVITAGVQFWQTKMLSIKKPEVDSTGAKDEGMQATLNKQMLYMMPIITIIIGIRLPSGLMLYWMVSTLLLGLQQVIQFRNDDKKTATVTVVDKGEQ